MDSYNPDLFPPDDGEIERLSRRARRGRRGFIRRMKAEGLSKGMRVLDLGCGEGILTARLASYVNPACAVGCDRSERLLERARNFAAKLAYPGLSFVPGTAENLPFPPETFDFVYARLLFQHLSRPAAALQEIYRVLAPGGVVVIEDIDHEMVFLHPAPAQWDTLRSQWCDGQRACGGDPTIGRKLAGLLRASPFGGGKVRVLTANGHGNAVREFACELGPSLVDYIIGEDERKDGAAMFARLAAPEIADHTDVFLMQFVASAVKTALPQKERE